MRLPPTLAEVKRLLAEHLGWPENLGVEAQGFCLTAGAGQTEALAVYLYGVADEQAVRNLVFAPLEGTLRRMAGCPLTPQSVAGGLLTPGVRAVEDWEEMIEAVLAGDTALFFDRAAGAVLVDTGVARHIPPAGGFRPATSHRMVFRPPLKENIGLLRARLQMANLMARTQTISGAPGRGAALVYLQGVAQPALLQAVDGWVRAQAGEEAFRRGDAAGRWSKLGMLPHVVSTPWPDQVAELLEAGYVVLFVESLPYAYVAPVTAAAFLLAPGDDLLRRPVGQALQLMRIGLVSLVILVPGVTIALLGYHQEMLPTPFLLGLASRRESAPFPVIAEVLGLLLIDDILREARARLPALISPGIALVAGVLIMLVMLQSGFVGPVAAVSVLLSSLATLGLPGYDLIMFSRTWRWPAALSAGLLGLLGLSAFSFCLTSYICQVRSFGVPFLQEGGAYRTARSWKPGAAKKGATSHE
ncbi:MAG TPA: spore germination protein [Symbiobacteriaceae bacterium]|nr:spore germination protein [Symbiobacteriaceae bacterium]